MSNFDSIFDTGYAIIGLGIGKVLIHEAEGVSRKAVRAVYILAAVCYNGKNGKYAFKDGRKKYD